MVKADCESCTVEVGRNATVTAEGRDPDALRPEAANVLDEVTAMAADPELRVTIEGHADDTRGTKLLLRVYLVAYFVLIAAALIALWRSGVLTHASAVWLVAALVMAVGLGVLLAVVSRTPRTPA